MREIFAPIFLANKEFASKMLVYNVRNDQTITVDPALLIEGHEIALSPSTITPHGTAAVDISAELAARRISAEFGAVVIRYDFQTTGAINAIVTSADYNRGLFLNSVAKGREEFMGRSFDAVVWAPERSVKGLVSILNTSSETRKVRATLLTDEATRVLPDIEIAPESAHLLKVDDLINLGLRSGAGIHFDFEGNPGDIMAEGQLMDRETGFTKRIQFIDRALRFADGKLYTNFLLLGRQPDSEGFPLGASFGSVAVLRNIDDAAIQVTPVVKFLSNGTVQNVSLPPVALGPYQSRTVDFSAAQKSGALPSGLHKASLELDPNTTQHSVIGELFNYNEDTSGYVVGPSFTAHPARGTTFIWRIDGTFQTEIAIENIAKLDDTVSLRFYSGARSYEKSLSIHAGSLIRVDVRDLLQGRNAEAETLDATSGLVAVIGSHGISSRLVVDELTYSAEASDYVGYLPFPCAYVTGADLDLLGESNPFSAVMDNFWSDGSLTQDAISPNTTNPTFTQISGSSVTADTSQPDGTIAMLSATEVTTGCADCSASSFFSANVTLRIAQSSWKWTGTINVGGCTYQPTCQGSCTTPFRTIRLTDPLKCPSFAQCSDLVVTIGTTKKCPISICTPSAGPGPCT